MPKLVILTEDGDRRVVELGGEPVSVGRSSANTISIPANRHLSRRHLSVESDGNRWAVVNLGSKNGLFVNGARVEDRRALDPGDSITATGLTITFLADGDEESAARARGDDEPATESVITTSVLNLMPETGVTGSRERAMRAGRADLLSLFLRLSREMARRQPLKDLFGTVLNLALEASRAERGVLMTLEGSAVTLQASTGGNIPLSRAVRDRVLVEGKSLLVKNVFSDQDLQSSETIIGQGVKSLLAVPLQTDERVIGMIYLESSDPRRAFTEDDLNLLTVMSYFSGIMIEREKWETLRRDLLMENATTLQQLAAAMSHEVNSPLGTFKSTIDTLFRLASRGQDEAAEGDRLSRVQSDLRRTLDDSVKRMSEVIERIQRWTNLDRADIQFVDLNLLLFDLLMLRLTPAGIDTPVPDIRLGELPEILCRPMTLHRVFAGLIDYAVRRAQAAPAGGGRVDIWTRPQGDDVIVEIADNGPPVAPAEAAQFFDLVFRVEGTRMTCNWDLFTARSDLREQGGDIRRECTPDRTNRFIIRLPVRVRQN